MTLNGTILSVVITAAIWPAPAFSDVPVVIEPGACENLQYSWQLRGGLSWIARLAFPTSGFGLMRTWNDRDSKQISSQLQITAPRRNDYYRYETEFEDETPLRTLMTYHGYAWGRKERRERTFFDYSKKLARRRKESPPDPPEMQVRAIPDQPLQDVLTGIYLLRVKAPEIAETLPGEIYSDGKLYKVVYSPAGGSTARVENTTYAARCFDVAAAEGAKDRWSGGLRICITDDDQRIPIRIVIRRGRLASLDLQLTSVSACATGDEGIAGPP